MSCESKSLSYHYHRSYDVADDILRRLIEASCPDQHCGLSTCELHREAAIEIKRLRNAIDAVLLELDAPSQHPEWHRSVITTIQQNAQMLWRRLGEMRKIRHG